VAHCAASSGGSFDEVHRQREAAAPTRSAAAEARRSGLTAVALWTHTADGVHPVLFRLEESLGEAGLLAAAAGPPGS